MFQTAYMPHQKRANAQPKPAKQRTFLRQWREYRNKMTQETLADRAGISQGMISQLENGQSDYTGELLEKLAYALRCEPWDIIMRNPLDTEAPWTIWAGLKPAQRKLAIKFLKALAANQPVHI